ncbi:MAG: hypothetical protein ACR2JB_04350 [Bryobacteraceae bacterium]
MHFGKPITPVRSNLRDLANREYGHGGTALHAVVCCSPLTFGAGVFNAGLSHVTNSDPRYGTNSAAFAQRFGASIADVATQNFLGDFPFASAFHEDPRYVRRDAQYHMRARIA